MAYLLDTNHLSPLVTLNHPLRQHILQAMTKGHTFAITVITLTETLYGIEQLPRAKQNLGEWRKLRPRFVHYNLDEFDAVEAAKMRLRLRRQGWQLHLVDALIATVAIRHDLILLTADQDFAKIPQLRQENWLI